VKFPNGSPSGFQSDAQKGAFKSANNLSQNPFGGGTAQSVSDIEKNADKYVMKHSTKGLGFKKSGVLSLKPHLNEGKAIGRKRGY